MGPNDDNETVLYEVNLEADAGIVAPFDTWLRDHIADMLQFEGFLSAEIFNDPDAPAGKIRRIVQYRLRDQAALERYIRDEAPRMREHGVAQFGDKFSAQRRVLAHREEFIRGAVSTDNCLNCGEVLTGQHCSHCGQRARVRVLSFTSLMRDLLGDVADFDSRIWRTLRPLAFKPGQLTVEFLRGRRTYYSPPFRMYLILSLTFFLAASIGADPGGDIELGSRKRRREPEDLRRQGRRHDLDGRCCETEAGSGSDRLGRSRRGSTSTRRNRLSWNRPHLRRRLLPACRARMPPQLPRRKTLPPRSTNNVAA